MKCTFSEATGVQPLNAVVPPGFEVWVGGFPGLSNTSPNGDPDSDGIDHLLEFILNGNPKIADNVILPSVTVTPKAIISTFARHDDSEIDTTLIFQHGSDLNGWTDVQLPVASSLAGSATITIVENNTDPDRITVSIPPAKKPNL